MKTNKEPGWIIMGSKSDWKGVMEHCSEMLKNSVLIMMLE